MNRDELISCCKYYKGEDECPKSYENTTKESFWRGEKAWVDADNLANITEEGIAVRDRLSSEKRKLAERYTDVQFGIIIFIETLFSSHDPYDNMRWIYEY